ncbi:MAG: nucleoside deaminase [Planctomycetota bacterium]
MNRSAPAWIHDAMDHVLQVTRQGIDLGQSPFGAGVFDDGGGLIELGHNEVKRTSDPTAHAEVVVIRNVSTRLGRRLPPGLWLISSCEPCPMCAGAIGFAGIRNVAFGATVDDAYRAGFEDLQLPSKRVFDTLPGMNVYSQVRQPECAELLRRR